MPTFLPSAPFIRIVGALIIVAGGIYGAYILATHEKSADTSVVGVDQAPIIIADNPLLKQVADLDSDKDGLRDWEEHLWKTSAMNKDTDGDGTSDGEEVSMNRNPTVKGPRDSMRETIDLEDNLTPESLADLTATERLSREFFVKYMSYKKGGKSLTKAEQNQLLEETLQKATEEVTLGKTYSEKDIVITTANDTGAYELYGNSIGSAILRNSFKTENELVLLERALRTRSVDDLNTIGKIAAGYRAILADFLLVPTPKDLVKEHVRLISNIDTIATALKNMTLIASDPVQSIVAVANYESYVNELLASIQDIQSTLRQHDVTYSPEETGAIFMKTGTQTINP